MTRFMIVYICLTCNVRIEQLFTGIYVKITNSTRDHLMHNKFCVIDVLRDEKTLVVNKHPLNGVFINGSMNWSMGVSTIQKFKKN